MSTATLYRTVTLCHFCDMTFAMPSTFKSARIGDGATFYCPAGHGQVYRGNTDAERLKRALAREQHLADQLAASERSNVALRGVVTRTKRRVGNGVCPCCNRQFANLARHMHGQHPDYSKAEA